MVNQIRTTGPSVTAIYADIERARAAMMTLERAGIDGNDIKLDEPSAQRPRTPDTSVARDTGVGKRVAKFSIIGGLIGGAAGVLAGVLVGVLLLDGGGVALWSAIAGMAFVGLSIGGVLVPMVVIGQGPNWEQTFEPAEATGRVRLHVRDSAAHDAARIVALLQGTDALRVEPPAGEQALGR